MNYLFVGLGNPGEEYENTRHNIGREVIQAFRKKYKLPDWQKSSNAQALYSTEKFGKNSVELLMPETFMNKSGKSVLYAVSKHKIKPENVVVVYDDIDLPLGKLKISFNRGSGGHRGVESVRKSLKTREFARVRIGISPLVRGKVKKPHGEKAVLDFILGELKKSEKEKLKKVISKTSEALENILVEGLEKTMGKFN
jgi:peptidyl-tRNA hydrolase, PTH1 family